MGERANNAMLSKGASYTFIDTWGNCVGSFCPCRVLCRGPVSGPCVGLFLTFVIMQRGVGIIILVESRPSGIVTVLE